MPRRSTEDLSHPVRRTSGVDHADTSMDRHFSKKETFVSPVPTMHDVERDI